MIDLHISHEDLFPLLRVAFLATNLTCAKEKCQDGIARLVTKTDFEKLRGPKTKNALNSAEVFLEQAWKNATNSNLDLASKYKAFGKACIRAVLLIVGKGKQGREDHEYKDLAEIEVALQKDLTCSQASTSAASASADPAAPSSMPVDLKQAKDPMFLASQFMEVKVGTAYTHKDFSDHVWICVNKHGDHLELQAQELFSNQKKTIKVIAGEIKTHLKVFKGKPPSLLDAKAISMMTPAIVCKQEADRAAIFQILFPLCKNELKKLAIQEHPSKKVFASSGMNVGECTLWPITDKVTQVVPVHSGKVFAKVIYQGETWYILPPKPWKMITDLYNGLLAPFWIVQGCTSKEPNMQLTMKDVKGLSVEVLCNTQHLNAFDQLTLPQEGIDYPKAKGSKKKSDAADNAPKKKAKS